MAAVTDLAGQAQAAHRKSIVIIVTTPDQELGRQAAALVRDVTERMPCARILLAVNHVSPTQRAGVDTPQVRAFAAQLQPCGALPRLVVPFARAQALSAFAGSRRTPLEILRANQTELVQLTGAGKLATLSAHTHFGAWWSAVVDQLDRYFPSNAR